MNYRLMGKFTGIVILSEAIFMIPAVLIGLYYGEQHAVISLLAAILITFTVGGVLFLFGLKSKKGFYAKEGLMCVSLSWLFMSLLGALPFYISKEIPSYVDAFFETVSGFTTTGASILPEVESMSKCLLYWRSFTHWVGGMGVLVFILALSSSKDNDNGFTMHILRAESPGPNVGKLVPRMRSTARILYLLYILLTTLDFFFLSIGGMSVFEAVCTAFGTAGTGGFGVLNDSIASYSPYIQNVCTVFMLLFGVNFSCYYFLLIGQIKDVFKDEELRFYIIMVVSSALIIAFNVRNMYSSIGETLRHSFFQVATVVTTTGFATTDFDLWPSFSKAILLILMVIGASAGSTGGGFKCSRVILVLKNTRRTIRGILYPDRVQVIRSNQSVVNERIIANTNGYLAAYVIIIIVSFLLVSLDNFSITTNFSAVIACFNNIGPGLDAVGPTCNYSAYSVFSKLILCFDMLAGRLEIFPVLILFSRTTWRR